MKKKQLLRALLKPASALTYQELTAALSLESVNGEIMVLEHKGAFIRLDYPQNHPSQKISPEAFARLQELSRSGLIDFTHVQITYIKRPIMR